MKSMHLWACAAIHSCDAGQSFRAAFSPLSAWGMSTNMHRCAPALVYLYQQLSMIAYLLVTMFHGGHTTTDGPQHWE